MAPLTRNQLDQQQRLQPEVTEQSNASPDMTAISAQLTQMIAIMATMTTRMEAFEARFSRFRPSTATQQSTQLATLQTTQQSTPPAPERQSGQSIKKPVAQKEEEQEKEQPLHQATVEDITEDIAESTAEKKIEQHNTATSKPDSDSTLSTIPRLCTTPVSRDPAAYLSNTLHLACQHAAFLACLRHGFLPGYIEWIEGMEATGQGWGFGAKNQPLVRQYLGHLAIRFFSWIQISWIHSNLRPENAPPRVLIFQQLSHSYAWPPPSA